MRHCLPALFVFAVSAGAAFAQEDKKTDDLKPTDPDTGESTVQESTLGLLPNPFEKWGVKFAAIGPSPPLATLGARLRTDVSDNLTLVGAIFDGDAAGPGPEDAQLRDRYGLNFRVNDPPLLLGEAQFLWNAKKGDPGLDGKFKLGGWRHFGNFSDQRFRWCGHLSHP